MGKQKKWTGERLETFVFNETTIEHLHRYAIALELAPGKKILDIASGEGYGANLLASRASEVTGVDIDDPTIEKAKKKYRKANLTFKTGSVEEIPATDGQFDMVVSFETLEHTDEHEKMMQEIKRVMAPGGVLLISTPDKKNYSDKPGTKNHFHKKELYKDEFLSLLKKYFSYADIYNQQPSFSSVIRTNPSQGTDIYQGDYEKIDKQNNEEALYFIGLASDTALPVLKNSVFNGFSVFENAIKDREKVVTHTITYRIGHFLLYPFKIVRKIFKK